MILFCLFFLNTVSVQAFEPEENTASKEFLINVINAYQEQSETKLARYYSLENIEEGVDKKLWYICLLFLLIVILYYISTGGIHMDDIKSPSAVTIGELSRIVKEFEEKIQNGTEDPNRFLTLTEIEELWGRLIGDTNVLYSDMVQSLLQNIDERGLVRQKKENSRPEE